ncbi:amino acid adenylation domain-containing protein [Streptomyces sp. AV19]|nr:amino acid adenylation domain-containing protein [Streptomyces sp. AV19]
MLGDLAGIVDARRGLGAAGATEAPGAAAAGAASVRSARATDAADAATAPHAGVTTATPGRPATSARSTDTTPAPGTPVTAPAPHPGVTTAAPAPGAPVTAPSAAPAEPAGTDATPFQQRLWLAEQAADGARNNVFLAWRVDGRLDARVLEDALARLVEGHEILRTAFRPEGDRVRQVVLAPWRPVLEAPAGDAPEDAATAWLDAAARDPFDLGSGRLLRAALADGPHGQALALFLHHLVVDGESVPVLLRELERCYRDALAGVPSAPPALQYRDRSEGRPAAADLDFWQERLAGAPAYTDFPAPARPGPDGAVRVPLPADLPARLRPVTDAHGASWFMAFGAALSVALHRWTGRPSLTLGVPVSTRGPKFAGLLGPCLNTVVLRSDHAAGATVLDALRAMRAEVLDAFEHGRAPFDEVLSRLRPERVPGRTPYADVALNMNLRSDRRAVLGDAELRPLTADSLWAHEAKFGLTLTVAEQDGALEAMLSYQGDRVAPADATALAASVAELLGELAGGQREIPTATPYRAFVEAQRAARGGAAHEAGLAHWQERLAGAPAYTDFPAPPPGAPHGIVAAAFTAGLGERLRTLQERHGFSPFMAVTAGLAILLNRRTGRDDVVISSPMTNRDRPGLADVLGPCLNTVALRTRFGPGTTVREALEAARTEVLGAFEHADVPFEDVVDRLNPPRRPGRTPYADVSLAFGTAPGRRSVGGSTLRPVALDGEGASYTGKLGLTVALTLDGDRLDGRLAYDGGRFRRADVEGIAEGLGAVLDLLPDSLDVPVAGLDLTTAKETDRIRRWERGPEPGPLTTVPELVLEQAGIRPDAPAVETADGTTDYRALVERARALAGALRPHLPADGGGTVALLLERGADYPAGMLAAWFAGAAFCPVDPSWPAARQEFVLGDVRADVLVTSPAGPRPAAFTGPVVEVTKTGVTKTEVTKTGDPASLPDTWSPDAPAYVIYTSGTTGTPKGAVIRHGGLADLVRWSADAFGIVPGDRCSHLLSVSFDSSQQEVWQALANGACLVPHEERVVPAALGGWLDGRRVDVAFLATALAEAVWSTGGGPRGLRWMAFGGAALSQRPPRGLPYRLMNSYGPTENTVASTEHEVDAAGDAPLNCVGRPLPGTRLLVLDDGGRRCPAGTTGEIHLAGRGLAVEYLGRPELTAERFRTVEPDGEPLRVYRTGDLGRWLADGTVEYLGRADRQLKIRGYRVEPGEIEHFLLRQPEVAHAAVTGDPHRTPALVGYVTARNGRTPDTDALLRRARAELPEFMVPEALVVLPALPLTTSGKVDHAALPAPERADLVGTGGYVSPGTGTERRVAALWSGVLGLERVGAHDNFFDLGGNSLALAKLHGRLATEFGRELPITALFEHTTVAALARLLDADGTTGHDDTSPRRPVRSGRRSRRNRHRSTATEGE